MPFRYADNAAKPANRTTNIFHISFSCATRACPRRRGVAYSRPTTGTGMPLQERFGARPMWACLVACPVNEITSFVVDSSRSRKSVFDFFLHLFWNVLTNNPVLRPSPELSKNYFNKK